MATIKYPHLFEPITLAGTYFRNRIFSSPTGWEDMDRNCIPSRDAVAYYERKAKGGCASVTLGELVVDSKIGKSGMRHIPLDDPWATYPLFRITNAVKAQGANVSAELAHAGLYASRLSGKTGEESRGLAYGPVDMEKDGRIIIGMSEEMIWETIEKFANAAAFAKYCGFSMVTVHAAHGWLISQFISPYINTRKDKWGGSIENRARFAVEICKAIRKKCGPKFPIEFRFSDSEIFKGGYDLDTGIGFARQIDGYCDLLNVSAGNHEVEEMYTVTHPSPFQPDGVNVKYAAEIKKHVNTPVATVGALSDPDLMEEILASGQADVIEIARGLICDPDLPIKARTGREKEIRRCMRCLSCMAYLMREGHFYCALNPQAGREMEARYEIPPAHKKKVLIAGGGIAGMEAALVCHERGHEVILCEKEGILGGKIRCEDHVPFKELQKCYLDRQAEAIKKAGIDVRLNTEVTPEYADKINADVIIAAIGSKPVVPPIKGIHLPNVAGAIEVYKQPELAGENVVILGGGFVGAELGIFLATLGRKVKLVEMGPKLNDGGNDRHVRGVKWQLIYKKVETHFKTKAEEITEDGVRCSTPEGEIFLSADTVIYAVGQKPLLEEANALKFCAPEFYAIADCVEAKNIMNATTQAYYVARNIGRV